MIVYYSGEGSRSNPEIVLQDRANIMLTFHDFSDSGKPNSRFRDIIDARKRKREQLKGRKKK